MHNLNPGVTLKQASMLPIILPPLLGAGIGTQVGAAFSKNMGLEPHWGAAVGGLGGLGLSIPFSAYFGGKSLKKSEDAQRRRLLQLQAAGKLNEQGQRNLDVLLHLQKQASGGSRKTWPDMNGTKPMKGIRPIPTVTPIKIESVFRKPPGMSETASRHNSKVGVAETPIMGLYREDNAAKDLHAAEAKSQEAQDAASRTGNALKTFKELMAKSKDKGPSSEMLAMDKSRADMEQSHLKAELASTKREMQLQKREMALAVPKPVENRDSGAHTYACKSLSARLSKLASTAPSPLGPTIPTPPVSNKDSYKTWDTPAGAKDLYNPSPKPQERMRGVPPHGDIVEPIRPGHLATQSFFPNTAMRGMPTGGFANILMQLRGHAGFGPGVHPDYAKYYNHDSSQNAEQSRLLAMLAAIQRMPSLSQMQ